MYKDIWQSKTTLDKYHSDEPHKPMLGYFNAKIFSGFLTKLRYGKSEKFVVYWLSKVEENRKRL